MPRCRTRSAPAASGDVAANMAAVVGPGAAVACRRDAVPQRVGERGGQRIAALQHELEDGTCAEVRPAQTRLEARRASGGRGGCRGGWAAPSPAAEAPRRPRGGARGGGGGG